MASTSKRKKPVGSIDRYPTEGGFLILSLVLLLLSGCAVGKLQDVRNAYYNGKPEKAAELLADEGAFPKRDQLLFLMENGQIFYALGRYEESIQRFLQAAKLMEEQEMISLTRQTSSLVTTEWITEFKGEYSERLWVHTYLMMNFLMVYRFDEALVEAKQALEILDLYADVFSKEYYTRALIAMCYDLLDENNDAFIEYEKLAKSLKDPQPVARDLFRIGHRLGFYEDVEQYKPLISEYDLDRLLSEPVTELVLFVETGRGPVKVPANIILPRSFRFSFPQYRSRNGGSRRATISDPVLDDQASVISTRLGTIARASLNARVETMLAKETARVATKEAIARAVEENNGEVAGALIRVLLFLTEEPDTRGWELLPARLSLVRLPLRPGKHRISVNVVDGAGKRIETIEIPEFEISPGMRIFRSIRSH